MRAMRRAVTLAILTGAVVTATAGAQGCGDTSCTAENHGLGDAPALALRTLPGKVNTEVPCAAEGVRLLASEAELQALYDTLEVAPENRPVVDFARERVIVNETMKSEGLNWAVQRGETAIVGLLGCGFHQGTTCVIQVSAVPALVTGVEARTCDPVRCGTPRLTPPRRR